MRVVRGAGGDRRQDLIGHHGPQHGDDLARGRNVPGREARRLVKARALEAESARLGVHRRRQLRRGQLHRATERRDGAVVRAHQRGVQQIAVGERQPLEQPRARPPFATSTSFLLIVESPSSSTPFSATTSVAASFEIEAIGRSLSAILGEDRAAPFVDHQRRLRLNVGEPAPRGGDRPLALDVLVALHRMVPGGKGVPAQELHGQRGDHRGGGDRSGGAVPCRPLEAPHHLDSYRGPSGAGKFPAGLGTEIFRQPCQYFSRSLATTAIAAVIRTRPTVAPRMLSRLCSRPSRRP